MKNLIIITIVLSVFFASSCNSPQKPDLAITSEDNSILEFKDHGPNPFVFDIEEYTIKNDNYRISLWTGKFMQMTLMSLKMGEEIGLELHDDIDQFIRIESGKGKLLIGDSEDNLMEIEVEDDFGIMIPAGKWHNLINISDQPLKLYSIYSPVEHPFGTIHKTEKEGKEAHAHHHH